MAITPFGVFASTSSEQQKGSPVSGEDIIASRESVWEDRFERFREVYAQNKTIVVLSVVIALLAGVLLAGIVGVRFAGWGMTTTKASYGISDYVGTWRSIQTNTVVHEDGSGTLVTQAGAETQTIDFQLKQRGPRVIMQTLRTTSTGFAGHNNPNIPNSAYFTHLSEDGRVMILLGSRTGVALYSTCKIEAKSDNHFGGC